MHGVNLNDSFDRYANLRVSIALRPVHLEKRPWSFGERVGSRVSKLTRDEELQSCSIFSTLSRGQEPAVLQSSICVCIKLSIYLSIYLLVFCFLYIFLQFSISTYLYRYLPRPICLCICLPVYLFITMNREYTYIHTHTHTYIHTYILYIMLHYVYS